MASSTKSSPGSKNRTEVSRALSTARASLIGLVVILIVLIGLLAWGAGRGSTNWTPRLALDLEGGTQMVLTPRLQGEEEGKEITPEQLDQAVEIIRQRVDGSGVSEAEVTTQGGSNIVVSMPGTPDQATRELIQTSAEMSFRPVLLTGAAEAVPEDQRTAEEDLPKPTEDPKDSSDTNWITADLMKEYESTDCTQPQTPEERAAQPTDKAIVACGPQEGAKYILGPVEIAGTEISDSSYGMAQGQGGTTSGQWGVDLQFNEEGTKTFESLSERLYNIGQTSPGDARNQFAILLDGEVISAPTMDAVIPNGKAQITGQFTEDSAAFLSEQLRYGSLPVSFSIASEQQISATLGADQLRMGIIAGLIGLGLVALWSIIQYKWLGWVNIISLVVLGIMSWLAITLLGWGLNYRLSLAGVAGLIVAIGMAADSFIVYFERIRDEVRIGRTIPAAIDHGWKRAQQTILASKAVNLIASVVLYFVAVGNVRGFAFTLGLTAVIDLLVVFFFTHPVMVFLSRTRYFGQGSPGSGLDPKALDAMPFYRGGGKFRTPEDLDPASGSTQADSDVVDAPGAQSPDSDDGSVARSRTKAARAVPTGVDDGLTLAERRRRARREAADTNEEV
ncbi:protein translocase subunit SecD [Kocuria sp. JC486]|uniref:Protein translocase subunit SecD n=1 Tax=Kocuria soli TaxID=2485125 RepID=A0A3N3ZSV6_9MICC|nr:MULTISPECIES: protein translocase subunit SecD [Kocuria]NHU84153.1 protein translocase subunit SecD [Kocuria sp. JC486]ROZ64701.1 protein translocase subunit SecD [Kocuria soli]